MTSDDIKAALRKRHPAYEPGYVGVGRWVTLEEWSNIDLLALDAWQTADVIGYEVKVSRADMRTELLRPQKRAVAVGMCTRFYFAVPAGLLSEAERDWVEPDWEPEDWKRARCSGVPPWGPPLRWPRHGHHPPRYGGQCQGRRAKGRSHKIVGPYTIEVPVPTIFTPRIKPEHFATISRFVEAVDRDLHHRVEVEGNMRIPCPECNGKGYTGRSRVEVESPTLWIPKDVGLVSVGPNGCSVIREAPKNKTPELIVHLTSHPRLTEERRGQLQRQAIAQLVRWTSVRPDPRHR